MHTFLTLLLLRRWIRVRCGKGTVAECHLHPLRGGVNSCVVGFLGLVVLSSSETASIKPVCIFYSRQKFLAPSIMLSL